ncbi:PREDICTED: C-type lectin domain family 4 member C-like [Priapulus caudatus]|uniref:C-type lectin domain family 4 member C-like n=1 Tax=Priapulus caudatus TaxID=37621 RepID=A0ABM1EFA0_PRICU|nr:PREDICTED: C-type lectin domain family 4 member C-like [Priapulus caudatus]
MPPSYRGVDFLHGNSALLLESQSKLLLKSLMARYGCCPEGFARREGTASCYLFSQHTSNWFAASRNCKSVGAELVVIETAEEDSFIRGHILSNYQRRFSFWIG